MAIFTVNKEMDIYQIIKILKVSIILCQEARETKLLIQGPIKYPKLSGKTLALLTAGGIYWDFFKVF